MTGWKCAAHWIRGWFLSTVLVWAFAPLFLFKLYQWQQYEDLGVEARPEGFAQQWRSEGWATTRFGRYGIGGIPDVRRVPGPKIAIWGDSFVEGLQVSDEEKLAQQVTAIWNRRHANRLTGVGIATGGSSVADYYFLIPKYEKVFQPVFHVIVLVEWTDFSPNETTFLSRPAFAFREPASHGSRTTGLGGQLAKFRPEFLLIPARNLLDDLNKTGGLRFSLGHVKALSPAGNPTARNEPEPPSPQERDAWAFALDSLGKRTEVPLVLTYVPQVPRLRRGTVLREDPNRLRAETLRHLCEERGIGFINAGGPFLDLYEKTGAFPFGFYNGKLAEGHLNANGHRQLAETICDYLGERFDAFHAD